MANHQPKVSIITINFNSTDVTAALLRSLEKITYPSIEVIVVDNSTKDFGYQLPIDFPWITYLEPGENLGFAGGNNKGLRIATGEYYLLLNNDTEVDAGFLEPLIARFHTDVNIGVVCPKILYFDEPDVIQFAGYTPINPISGRGFGIGYLEKDTGQHDKAMPTSRAHGAAMIFSKVAFEKVGLMAELFFLYYEEMDYCERFKRAGYTIWYEPSSKVWHKESMSTGKGSTLKTYYYSRNRLLYLRRNTFGYQKILMYIYYTAIALPKNLLGYLVKRDWPHLKAFWQGFIWNFSNSSKDEHDLKT